MGIGWGCLSRQVAHNPGADNHLMGTVPAGAVVPVHGSHLRKRATRVMHPTAMAAPSGFLTPGFFKPDFFKPDFFKPGCSL